MAMKTVTYDDAQYKLVPIEPTPEMERAAFDVLELAPASPTKNGTSMRNDVWKAMLAAAPKIEGAQTLPAASSSAADERDAGIELAAQWVQKRFDDWDTDHGCTDPETGVREYGNQAKEDYACELLEIIEGIRALKNTMALSGGER